MVTVTIHQRDGLNWCASASDGAYSIVGHASTARKAQSIARDVAARQARAWRLQGTHVGKLISRRYVALGRVFTKAQ